MNIILIFLMEIIYYAAIIAGAILMLACVWLLVGYLLDKHR